VARTYTQHARAHGVRVDEDAVREGFRRAMARPWPGLRQAGDGRPFWRMVVHEATGSEDPALFEDLYALFARPQAWRVAPGALPSFDRLRAAGIGVAIASNWDDRLRPLLAALGILDRVDAAAISSEVGAEKPDPTLFLAACAALGVPPAEAVHVGDDPNRDVAGARAAGLRGWRWGEDVTRFSEVARRLLRAKGPA